MNRANLDGRLGAWAVLAWGALASAGPATTAETVKQAQATLVAEHPDGARVERWVPPAGADPSTQLQALLVALGDPTTRVLSPAQWKAFLAEVSGQPTVGVGLRELLDVDLLPDGRLGLVTTQPGGAAARARLRAGDVLARVDGVEVRSQGLAEVMERLRGKAGTPVRVEVLRGEQPLTVELRRGALPAGGSHVRSGPLRGGSVLEVAVDGFAAETAAAVGKALDRHPGMPVVFDLRNNPGGQLDAALAVAGLFLGERDVARQRTKEGSEVLRSTGRARPVPRVVVLVNEGTASAGELLALALRDAGHAAVVGKTTRGKALVHVPRALPDGSWLLISAGKIAALDGTELLGRGLVPDPHIEWPESLRVPLAVPGNPDRDPQLAAALHRLDRGV